MALSFKIPRRPPISDHDNEREAAAEIILQLDLIAREYDKYEYGLPIFGEVYQKMIDTVTEWRAAAVKPVQGAWEQFGSPSLASTGYTEECTAVNSELGSLGITEFTLPSPSSPLNEEKLTAIIGEAIRLAEGKADWNDYYLKCIAPRVYRALLPHLSDTSAEKARVKVLARDALGSLAQINRQLKISKSPREMISIAAMVDRDIEHIRKLAEALAAFEKGY